MTRQTQATRRYGFETERPKSPPKGARAIVGVRVSAEGERDGETATSAPEQREWAAWQIQQRDLVRVEVDAEDMSVPGGIDHAEQRYGLWRALEAIEAGDADVLMFQNTKRMARDIELGAHVRRRVEAAGGWLILGDCPDGAPQAMFGLLLGQGQDDHSEKKGYLRSAKIAATVKGVSLGKVPYGYRRGPEGVLVIEEEEAAVVRELFELRAAGGSWRQLAELFRTRSGMMRAQASLDHMIQNRKYRGEVWFEQIKTEAAHPAIVSEDLFKAANARRKGGRPKSGAKALLSGIARCGTCDYGMTSTMSGAAGYRMRVYRCSGRVAGACAAPAMANADKVDAIVKADVWDWIEGRGHADHVYVSSDEERMDTARLAVMAAEADAVHWAAAGSLGLSMEATEAGSAARAALVAAAARELERMEAADQIGVARIKLRDLWADLTLEELRYLLGEIGLVVVIDRAPRGTELRSRVRTIVGGRLAATAKD